MEDKRISTDSPRAAEKAQPGVEVDAHHGRSAAMTPAARRALAEAEARRRAAATHSAPREIGGRGGLDPARYGDWEKNGLASDF
jgi:hypothetical protein